MFAIGVHQSVARSFILNLISLRNSRHMTVFLRPVQVWAPPTPPRDDSDVYMDSVDDLLYEETPMTEAQLPPVFVKKEPRRIKTEPGVTLREYTVPLP